MIKKTSLLYGSIFCLSLFFLAACQPNVPTDQTGKTAESTEAKGAQKQKKFTVKTFLKEVKKANREVESVDLYLEADNQSNSETKKQKLSAHILFAGPGQETIKKSTATLQERDNSKELYQEFILVGDAENHLYSRSGKDEEWRKEVLEGEYDVEPNYHKFLDIIYSMEEDLKLEDDDEDGYTLTLRSQNIDIISLFEDELNMHLEGISQKEVEKEMELTFTKDFYLEEIDTGFGYDGQKGKLDVDVRGTFSNWNEVDDSYFEAPNNINSDA